MLTQERLKKLLHYDPDTGVFAWMVNRGRKAKVGTIAGFIRSGYRRIQIDGKTYTASHVAWLYVTGEFPIDKIDHRDLSKDNNRFSNLRQANDFQNKMNSPKYKNNTSGFKRVCWHKQHKKWQANIKVDGKQLHLGYFQNVEAASEAYKKAALKYYGEFARTE